MTAPGSRVTGFPSGQFFLRFVLILTVCKAYDRIFFNRFLRCKFRFFRYYFPEASAPCSEKRIRKAVFDKKTAFSCLFGMIKFRCALPPIFSLVVFSFLCYTEYQAGEDFPLRDRGSRKRNSPAAGNGDAEHGSGKKLSG